MANVFPFFNIDAITELTKVLDETKVVNFGTYLNWFSVPYRVDEYTLEPFSNDEDNVDLLLTLGCTRCVTQEANKAFIPQQKEVFKLHILSPAGDQEWSYVSKVKVWDGNYPSTVAVDIKKGTVYFVYMYNNTITLKLFGRMTEKELENFEHDYNDHAPYKIVVPRDVLFKYFDDSEGLNYVKANIGVEFNAGIPFIVKTTTGS